MKKFRILSLTLAALSATTFLTGCVVKIDNTDKNATNIAETSSIKETLETPEDSETPETPEAPETPTNKIPTALTATKIGSAKIDGGINHNNVGFSYYSNQSKKYGIMSLDCKYDTGAKFATCHSSTLENYFEVSYSDEQDLSDISTLNNTGVVDEKGNVIVPIKYATIKELNERYIQVTEVTEQTTNKSEALVYLTGDMLSLGATDKDVLLKGNWYIYDVTTGMPVHGITGTMAYSINAYGNYIEYVNDNGEKIIVNNKGEKLPEGATLFDNGCYAVVENGTGVVYDTNDGKLFNYQLDGFAPIKSTEDYFLARRSTNHSTKYVYIDKTGKTVSAEFDDYPTLYGNLVFVDSHKKIYNLKGEEVYSGICQSVHYDKQFKNTWIISNDPEYTLITEDGTILWQGSEEDGYKIDTIYFTISKKVGDKTMYYSHADKDFTIEGNYFSSPWIVTVEKANNIKEVVDTLSGKTLITGYSHYSIAEVPGSCIYVYACSKDNNYDIYMIK